MITGFPEDLRPFRLALIKALTLKGLGTEASVVSNGALTVSLYDHDNWNGGTDAWSIKIEIALEFFIEHESQIGRYETIIRDAANLLFRGDEHNTISVLSLVPVEISTTSTTVLVPEAYPATELWGEGRFRLFISHCSSIKESAKKLRDELATFGISAFVAHEDIKPTKIWLTEIEKALDSMDALSALLTPDFPNSEWCDQEVGIAIGKTKLLVPIRLGIDPYGFMGKYQGIPGRGKKAEELAREIATALLNSPSTKFKMSEALINKFINSNSYMESRSNIVLLENLDKLTEKQAKAIADALNTNDQIYDAFGVARRTKAVLKKHGHEKLIAPDETDDEIPF